VSEAWEVVPIDQYGDIGDWMVVIESAAADPRAALDAGDVEDVIGRLAGWDATAMYCADRYAVVMRVAAVNATDALRAAVEAHAQAALSALAVQDGGGPACSVVRAEVLRAEDFEASLSDTRELVEPPTKRYPGLASEDLYSATRSLLWSSTAEDVDTVVANFVTAAGGAVRVGPRRHLPGLVSVDFSLQEGATLSAVAATNSATALLLEESLPSLVEDAGRVLEARRPTR
jgi:hypothetical protein